MPPATPSAVQRRAADAALWDCTMCGIHFTRSRELQEHWTRAHAVAEPAFEAPA